MDRPPVHQYKTECGQSTLCATFLGQLIPGVSPVHPNALLWVGGSDLLDKAFLVSGSKALPPGKTVDIDRCRESNNLFNFWSKLSPLS